MAPTQRPHLVVVVEDIVTSRLGLPGALRLTTPREADRDRGSYRRPWKNPEGAWGRHET
jgi:hypothetical protein